MQLLTQRRRGLVFSLILFSELLCAQSIMPTTDHYADGVVIPPDFWLKQLNVQATGYGMVLDGEYLYVTGESHDHPILLKYDMNGEAVWTMASADKGWGRGITLDSKGFLYMAGYEPGYQLRAFIAKYATNGQRLWKKTIRGRRSVFGDKVAVDSSGYIYLAGITNSRLDYGAKNTGAGDLFLAKYRADGERLWLKQYGTPLDDQLETLKVDKDDRIYLFGTANNRSKTSQHLEKFAYKLDNGGRQLWYKRYNLAKSDQHVGMAVDLADELYVIKTTGEAETQHRLLFYQLRDNPGIKLVSRLPDNLKVLDGFIWVGGKQLVATDFHLGVDVKIVVNSYDLNGALVKQEEFNTPNQWDLAFDQVSDGNGRFCLTGNTHGSFLKAIPNESFYNLIVACRAKSSPKTTSR